MVKGFVGLCLRWQEDMCKITVKVCSWPSFTSYRGSKRGESAKQGDGFSLEADKSDLEAVELWFLIVKHGKTLAFACVANRPQGFAIRGVHLTRVLSCATSERKQ
jgi:hypothetical protein